MISISDIVQKFNTEQFDGSILRSENMANHTTIKVGGQAPIFVSPKNIPSLIYALSIFHTNNIPYFVIGGGSNIIVSDKGFEGAVIHTGKLKDFSPCTVQSEDCASEKIVCCSAGENISSLVSFCTENKCSGLETFAGLPGTVGGAIYMNASCFDVSISDRLLSCEYIDLESLKICEYIFNPDDWDYKKSPFQQKKSIITNAKFRVHFLQSESTTIAERCKKYILERSSKGHFKYPSAGSVFKNNHSFGEPSGKLIDLAGLKGYRIGGAQVAPWHGNFIINVENASAMDVKDLIEFVKKKVYEKTGFMLEEEVILCGLW